MIKNDVEMRDEDGGRGQRGLPVPEVQEVRYRVGRHQPQNIYDRDRYIGVMFDAPYAARVVAALNNAERVFAAEKWSG